MSQAGLFISGATPATPVETLSGNDAIKVGPDGTGNIQILGGPGITVTNTGANTETINLSGVLFNYKNITFAMSPYTILPTDYYLSVDSSGGAITIDLPLVTTTNRTLIIKDRTGDAAISNISIIPAAGATVDGGAIYIIQDNWDSVTLLFNSSNYETY